MWPPARWTIAVSKSWFMILRGSSTRSPILSGRTRETHCSRFLWNGIVGCLSSRSWVRKWSKRSRITWQCFTSNTNIIYLRLDRATEYTLSSQAWLRSSSWMATHKFNSTFWASAQSLACTVPLLQKSLFPVQVLPSSEAAPASTSAKKRLKKYAIVGKNSKFRLFKPSLRFRRADCHRLTFATIMTRTLTRWVLIVNMLNTTDQSSNVQ